MSKIKYRYCTDSCQGVKETPHTFMGIQEGEETPFGRMAPQLVWKCECGKETLENIPTRRCHKRTWPYHNASAGVTFESESHEQAYTKAKGLTPA